MLSEALALHQKGKLEEARLLYEQFLQQYPGDAEALHLLGVVHLQQGDSAQATELIRKAISIQPDNPVFYGNLVNALHQQGLKDDALAWIEKAVSRFPAHAESHYNKGIILSALARHDEAVNAFATACKLQPTHVTAFYNLGNAWLQLENFQSAALAYEAAVKLKPAYTKAWYNLGKSYRELNLDEKALAAFDKAIQLDPAYAKAYYNRGNTLQSLKRHDEAIADYDRCLSLQPDDHVAMVNKGNALLSKNDYVQAATSYQQAIDVRPDIASYHNNQGNALLGQKQPAQALDAYGQAIRVDPLEKDAHFNRAICYLLMGDLLTGFEEYEWRWQTEDLVKSIPALTQPAWRGEEDLTGKKVLLFCEQGLGDTIQFARYASMVSDLGAHVILVVQPELVNLLRGMSGKGDLIANGMPVPEFDYHCPLLSLPKAFKTTLESIPASQSYIQVDEALAASWSQRLGPKRTLRIGLAWSGRPEHKNDHNRSLTLAQLVDALPIGPDYVCIQKELRQHDKDFLQTRQDIRFFGDQLKDFADTAALCSHMDLIISVDTSVAHMSAAIGKPTWILLPYIPDWRWMLDRTDSPWYPTVTLFRQQRTGDWESLVRNLKESIQREIASHSSRPAEKNDSPATSHSPEPAEPSGTTTRLPVMMNWQVGSNFGWGLVGLNMLQQWANDPDVQPLMSYEIQDDHIRSVDALRKFLFLEAARASNAFLQKAVGIKEKIRLDVPVIEAMGNDLLPRGRFFGSRNLARVVFEDTRLDGALQKLDRYDRIVTISNWNRNLLCAKGLSRVEVTFEGIDPSIFFPGPRSGLMNPSRFYIFSGGKIEFRKGQDILLKAFSIFAQKHPDAVLVTAWQSPFGKHSAGFKGGLDAALQLRQDGKFLDITRWAVENGVPAHQIMDVGLVPNHMMPSVLREMDCAIQVSRAEGGTNLPAKEAMACGVPIILSKNTGVLDLIAEDNCIALERQTGVDASLANSGTEGWGESDVDEIVHALEALYDDQMLRKRLAANGAGWMLANQRTWRDHALSLKKVVLGCV